MNKEKLLKEILEKVEEYTSEKKVWVPGKDWVKYSGPYFDSSEYTEAIKSLLSEWIIFGEKCHEFEQKFPEQLGKKYGILTNSGSSANLLMVAALKALNYFKDGDKIIVPVVSFPTTVNPIIQCGLEPIFVDVTLPDCNMNLDEVERLLKLDNNIRGLMLAPVFGNPPNMYRIKRLCARYSLTLMNDECDSLGSSFDDINLGSFGEISTCSFFPAHHMTLCEGGFLATDNFKILKKAASLRDWGRDCFCNVKRAGDVTDTTACGNRFRNWFESQPDIIYDHRYIFSDIGYNLKPIELQGAIGLQQIKKLPSFHIARRRNFKKLYKIFEQYQDYFILPETTELADPSWFAFLLTVRDNDKFNRDDFVKYLESKKIQTRPYFTGNLLYHKAYEKYRNNYVDIKRRFPNAHTITTSTMFLGTFIGIDGDQMKYVQETVNKFMEKL